MATISSPSPRLIASESKEAAVISFQHKNSLKSSKAPEKSGYKLVNGEDAFYRFSDITFEWHKRLTVYQANALKSLLSLEALVSSKHPLRQKLGNEEGVVFQIGMCKDGKPRLLISYRQVEYLRYWIRQMKLVKDDEDGFIPLPSTNSLIFEANVKDLVPMILNDPRLIKRAVNKPNQIYINLKEGKTADGLTKQDLQQKEERDRASAGEQDEKETVMDKETGGSPTKVDPEDTMPESEEVECGEIQEIGPAERREPGPRATYYHAEQAFIIASSGGCAPAYAPNKAPSGSQIKPAGKGTFLSIDFDCWELEMGRVLDIGWAAVWFEENDEGEWDEKKDQGHWAVKEHMELELVPETRSEYLFGTSEVLAHDRIYQRVSNLISDIHKRSEPDAGPLYFIIHSTHKELDLYGLLDLPVETFERDLWPKDFIAPAYATKKADGKVFVIDTSELVDALSDGQLGDLSLEAISQRLLSGSGEDIVGFGNSGNNAVYNLESFLAMVYWKFDIAKTYIELEAKLSEGDSDAEDDVERYMRDIEGVGLDTEDVEFSLRDLEYDIGPGGPEAGDFDSEDEE